MVFDPFSIAALGVGTLGSLGGAIYGAATASDRKKKFLEEQQRIAQRTAMRHGRMTNFFDTANYPIDAKYKEDAVKAAADEMDPEFSDFLPFVQNGTRLAGAIYDAGLGSSKPDPSKLPDANFKLDDPSQLEYYNPEEIGRDAKAPWEELEYYDPRQQTPWWRR